MSEHPKHKAPDGYTQATIMDAIDALKDSGCEPVDGWLFKGTSWESEAPIPLTLTGVLCGSKPCFLTVPKGGHPVYSTSRDYAFRPLIKTEI